MTTLVLGNQLYRSWLDAPKNTRFIMIESRAICARYRYHRQKLVLVFAAMRQFAETLRSHGFEVDYWKLEQDESPTPRGYTDILGEILKRRAIRELTISEIPDRGFDYYIRDWAKSSGIKIKWDDRSLFCTPIELLRQEISRKKPFMKNFYEWQRKRMKLLVDDQGNPEGGQWSFDSENRKKLPSSYQPPRVPLVKHSEMVLEVMNLVDRLFPDSPGRSEDFWLPSNHEESERWLKRFLSERFDLFGPYEDSIPSGGDPEWDLLQHSALAPLMNIGLLTTDQILAETLKFARKNKIPIASLEGFIRQIIGWREFIRGIDIVHGESQAKSNFFGHERKLKSSWYTGSTGLRPLDDAIRKTVRRGYNHHIERLMLIGNAMLLSRVAPTDSFRWFMEMYIDAYEWVMGPNVYGMSQFSDGGIFATKPYICGSNYILKMSDYGRGPWCEVWDGLYWNFIADNRKFFSGNPRLAMMGKLLERMPASKLARHRELAERFISEQTE